jgi:uncharacterized protein (DUF433 family)
VRSLTIDYAPQTVTGLSNELERGVYAPSEAARVSRLETKRVRRWLGGYNFRSSKGELRHSGPVFPREHDGETLALTFMDLVEVLYVRAFIQLGVNMRKIRLVHQDARAEFHVQHAFAVKKFESDGCSIFYRFTHRGDRKLEDRYTKQLVNRIVFDPLMKKLEYGATGAAARYWPMGKNSPVVLDPRLAFGEAILAKSRVPTRVIYLATRSGESTQRIAHWYKIDLSEAEAAIEFEKSIRRSAAA